jgi:hypothetical protein
VHHGKGCSPDRDGGRSVNYSSGVWGLGSIAVAESLPTSHALWLVARVLLDAAGAVFLLYILALAGLTSVVLLSPRGRSVGRHRLVPPPAARHRSAAA